MESSMDNNNQLLESDNSKELILDAIYHSPKALLTIEDIEVLDIIDDFLPYSIGFEIECNMMNEIDNIEFNVLFQNNSYILDINCDKSEQRFRIPTGLKGMICLYNICENLKKYSLLNSGSGIHYHVDMTDIFHLITNDIIEVNNDWIIEELKLWNTAKDYDKIYCCTGRSRCWCRYSDEHKTLEIRIGEMSFDYEVIIKRIIQASNIVRKLKSKLLTKEYLLDSIDKKLEQLIGKNKEVNINIKNRIIII